MKKTLLHFIFSFIVFLPLYSQEVKFDTSFFQMHRDAGSGFNGSLKVLFPQDDGKHLVGGNFTTYNSKPASGLIRLLYDGRVDSTFQTGIGFQSTDIWNLAINSIQIQADKKILIGGSFTSYMDMAASGLIRLNQDGNRDNSFKTGTGFDEEVTVVLLQSSGKVLVGGRFTTYQDKPVPSFIRINPDGSRDTSFNSLSIFNKEVHTATLQPDGRILVNAGNKFVRLHPDGIKDESFQLAEPYGTSGYDPHDPSNGIIDYTFSIKSICLQDDGKILLNGAMESGGGRGQITFMRLHSDGSLDNSFQVYDSYYGDGDVSVTKNQIGEIYVVNDQNSYSSSLMRLLSDGTPDDTFQEEYISDKEWKLTIDIIEAQNDGKLLISGTWNGNNGLFRFDTNGLLDRYYNSAPEFNREVLAISKQLDGKILVGGTFTGYNGKAANNLARIHPDGTLDETFNSGTGLDLGTYLPNLTLIVQPDERILVVGRFSTFNGNKVEGIVRLNPDGSRDESFQTGSGLANQYNLKSILQDDGKVIIATPYDNSFNGIPFQSLIRINSDGSKDPSFDIGSGFDRLVTSISNAPGGKILVGGDFTTFNGHPANRLVRLNTDGSLDPTFEVKEVLEIEIKDILVQPDGKILAVGSDEPSTLKSRLLRFNTDGSPNAEFQPKIPARYPIGPIALQSDGRILLAIVENEHYLARLLPDGSIDPTFKLTNKFNGAVNAMTVDSEDNLFAGGNFTSLNDKIANRFVKIPNIVEQPTPFEEVIRINAGGPSFFFGSEEWLADTHFTGGRVYFNPVPISNTKNETLFQTERYGDVKYEIPVPMSGVYTVELHFAEIHWDRPGARLFDLFLEDNIFRSKIDLAKDIGINNAGVIRIENVKINDGNLSLEMLSLKDNAKISGIALFKQVETKTPETIRINAGGEALHYAGEEWLADRYYVGGQNHFDDFTPISNTTRNDLFHSTRNGTFSYRIPVPKAGRYVLDLSFAEKSWQTEGQRVFDVLINNGQHKLENIDLVKTIGEPHSAYTQSFGQYMELLEVMDGELILEFIPLVHEATLSGLSLHLQQPEPWAPLLTNPEDIILDEGQEWNYQIDATAQNPEQTLTFLVKGLPEGVSYDPLTGLISGSFSVAGHYNISLKVSDQNGASAYSDISITVVPLSLVARINSGGGVLQFGDEQWQADKFYTGGRTNSTPTSISNTNKSLLYQSERYGDFTYEIPVNEKGAFTVELHFAEIHWKWDNARLFRFRLENEPSTEIIDLHKDHGGANNAYVLRISNVQVVDGVLNLEMLTEKDWAKLSGIAVYKQRTTYPPNGKPQLRVNAGGPTLILDGDEWMADSYFEGGRTYGVGSIDISNTDIDGVYQSERYGNFSYSLPAAEAGLYALDLHFAEIHWNYSGARVFGLEIENGQYAVENLDLFRDYGGKNSAYMIRAENIMVSDGHLNIKFNSQVNNAKLSGITLYKQSELVPNARIAQEVLLPMQQESGVSDGEELLTSINLYPNPARDRINLEFDADHSGVWNILLINSLGVPTYLDRQNLEKGRHHLKIDLSAYRLSAGTYYLQLNSDSEAPRVLRVIIQ